jgi:exopolysaccharide biosynthesis polyprenyl glycosylphosphotransferase
VVGYVVTEPLKGPIPADCLGSVDALGQLVEEHGVDEILLLGDLVSKHATTLLDIIHLSERLHLRLHIVPGLYESLVGKLDLYEVGGIPLIEFKQSPLSGTYAVVKRAMDIGCALIGLVLSLPILAVAAVALKLDSKGPVFFRQVRCGRGGREFNIIKLRTMHVGAEATSGPVRAGKNDSRVTAVGRFLRTKRIDEIPQLWNVLKGDMSLVGPRPERPFFVEQFTKEVPLFPLRLRVRPGVTALSHVWGRYTSTPIDRLRYDLVYMSNISFMLDVRILLDTVKTVLTGRGAQ